MSEPVRMTVEPRDCWTCHQPTLHQVTPMGGGLRRCVCQVCGAVWYQAPPWRAGWVLEIAVFALIAWLVLYLGPLGLAALLEGTR
jgi:hypothetical protein